MPPSDKKTAGRGRTTTGASTGSALRQTASPTGAGTAPAARRAAPGAPPWPPTTTTRAATVQWRGDGCSGSPTRSSPTTRAKGAGRDRRTNRSPGRGPGRLPQLPREGRTERPSRPPTTKGPRGARTTAPSPRAPTTRRTTAIKRSKGKWSCRHVRFFQTTAGNSCPYKLVPLLWISCCVLHTFFFHRCFLLLRDWTRWSQRWKHFLCRTGSQDTVGMNRTMHHHNGQINRGEWSVPGVDFLHVTALLEITA